jgi:phosphoadenosine phosphosulfate reductase
MVSKLPKASQVRDQDSLGAVTDSAQIASSISQCEELLNWCWINYGCSAAIGTSLQGSGLVLLHLALTNGLKFPVFTIDTDLLFEESVEFKKQVETFFNIKIEVLQPTLSLAEQMEQFGENLWEKNPDLCCRLRKIRPLHEKLSSSKAWITGIRRDQTAARKSVEVIEILRIGQSQMSKTIIKLNPLANWSNAQVDDYLLKNSIPINPLHKKGYPSIGCYPCTRPVGVNSESREGRWQGFVKTECGIHTTKLNRE